MAVTSTNMAKCHITTCEMISIRGVSRDCFHRVYARLGVSLFIASISHNIAVLRDFKYLGTFVGLIFQVRS